MRIVNRLSLPRRLAAALPSRTHLPAILALFVIVLASVYAESQNRTVHDHDARASVLSELSLIRAKLEGNVNGNIQLVRGLVATLSTEPSMSQSRFSELASALLDSDSQLRSIAAAPGLVVRIFYPVEPNRALYGLDYTRNEAQREAAFRARDTGKLVFAGPVDLVQGGGQGFIGRFPVFITEADRSRTFWGIVSAVIDVRALYRDSGLLSSELPIDVAIVGRDALGAKGDMF